jgi:hypothetical protein
MITIDAEILLVNYFLRNNNGKLSYGDIRELEKKLYSIVKEKCGKEIYIYIDKNSLCAAIENYPQFFRWCKHPDGDDIEMADEEYYYYYNNYKNACFNSRLDKEIKKEFLEAFDEIMK